MGLANVSSEILWCEYIEAFDIAQQLQLAASASNEDAVIQVPKGPSILSSVSSNTRIKMFAY